MCTVSNIGDGMSDYWRPRPWYPLIPLDPLPSVDWPKNVIPQITREEFDALKKEVSALKDLLTAAKKFDAETGQPDCEMDEKVRLLQRIAQLVGVDLSEIFTKEAAHA